MGDPDVLIAGGGPVGLTLAIELGQLGVRCELVDKRPRPGRLPKMERCNARTMEFFRRMGIAGRVRAAGLPADVPMPGKPHQGAAGPPRLPVGLRAEGSGPPGQRRVPAA
jgi:NADPH-dependent 2,4-dienoyl-CoA reductase/sulfur reductase-like enzyme